MRRYPEAAWERAMKIQEVILRVMAKRLTWCQAVEIIGISDRQMRRWKKRYEDYGYDGLFDRRRGKPSPCRVSVAQLEEVLRLYQEKYFDLNVRHRPRRAAGGAWDGAELHLGEAGAARSGAGEEGPEAGGASQTAPASERFEVLALIMGDREQIDLWEGVFRDLAERDLNLEAVEFGIMDGLPGLEEMFKKFFPRAQTQRCQKHAKANACRRVRKKERELFSKALNTIFYAPMQSDARAAFFKVKEQWGRLFPSAVQAIEKDLNSLLTFFQFDATYWTVLRTTNPIERLNKEFKRRTRAMEVTGAEISTYRCLVYDSQTMEYRWSFHPLSQWSTVYTQLAA